MKTAMYRVYKQQMYTSEAIQMVTRIRMRVPLRSYSALNVWVVFIILGHPHGSASPGYLVGRFAGLEHEMDGWSVPVWSFPIFIQIDFFFPPTWYFVMLLIKMPTAGGVRNKCWRYIRENKARNGSTKNGKMCGDEKLYRFLVRSEGASNSMAWPGLC